MQTIKIDQQQWDKFVIEQGSEFCQSWHWKAFQERLGRKTFPVFIKKDGKIALIALIVKYPLPFGKSYFYCSRGPLLKKDLNKAEYKEILFSFLDNLKQLAKKEKAIFFQFEPLDKNMLQLLQSLKKNKGSKEDIKKVRNIQPWQTWILDIKQDQKDILEKMHHKTRYNIRLAERNQLKIVQDNSKGKEFISLLKEVAEKNHFRLHTDEHYFELLKLNPKIIKLYLIYLQDKPDQPIAANLMLYFGKTAVYMHGGSDYDFRKKMAPYALHWRAFQDGKAMNCSSYDFWGIDEQKWPSLTRFKKGFGGKIKEYPGTYQMILNPFWYKVYLLAKILLRK